MAELGEIAHVLLYRGEPRQLRQLCLPLVEFVCFALRGQLLLHVAREGAGASSFEGGGRHLLRGHFLDHLVIVFVPRRRKAFII